jgi:ABC-type transport system involved in multi-copper enzyme maturation permease subunit
MAFKAFTLFDRALREDVRQLLPHLLRVGLGGYCLLVVCFFALMADFFTAPGLNLFNQVVWLNFLILTVLGISQFSSVVSEEKEAQTIGLLRMAGITPLALIIGKTVGRLWGGLMLLITQLPFVFLAVTLGGVSLHQLLAAYATLAIHLLSLAYIALLCSMLASSRRNAAGLTAVAVLSLLLGTYLIEGIAQMVGGGLPQGIYEAMVSISAWDRLGHIGVNGFDQSIFINAFTFGNLAIAAVCFLISMMLFNRYAVDTGVDEHRGGESFLSRLGLGGSGRRAWNKPILWKDFHYHLGGWPGFTIRSLLLVLVIGLILVAWSDGGRRWPDTEEIAFTLIILAWVWGTFQAAWHAAKVFGGERQSGTWSSLLLMPMTTYQLFWQKFWATSIHLIPVILLFLIGMVMAPGDMIEDMINEGPFFLMVTASIFFVHLAAWYSLLVPWGAFALALVTCLIVMPILMGIATILFAFVFILTRSAPWMVWLILGLPVLGFSAFIHWHTVWLMRRQGA